MQIIINAYFSLKIGVYLSLISETIKLDEKKYLKITSIFTNQEVYSTFKF